MNKMILKKIRTEIKATVEEMDALINTELELGIIGRQIAKHIELIEKQRLEIENKYSALVEAHNILESIAEEEQ